MRACVRLSILVLPVLLSVSGLAPPPAGAARAAPPEIAPGAHPPPSPARVLVFTATRGWRHDSIPDAVDALRALVAADGLEMVHSEDPAQFDDANLRGFRTVVFANTTHDVLDDSQQAALERFVRGGGGFVGIHSAADTEYGWPWYGELVGAWFESHPPGLQTTDVRFEPAHRVPALDGWRVTDEIYSFRRNPRPFVDVIATVDGRMFEGGTMGADHPIAWCHARFGGRAWYTALGHDRATYADPRFREHLRRGLRYAGGRADDC